MIFRSKVDLWLIVVIAISVTLNVNLIVGIFQSQSSWFAALICLCFGIALPISLLTFTRYEVDGDCLLVRSGPFRWKILLSSVRKIEATKSSASGPALSLDRLRVDYEKSGTLKSILISPLDQEGFRAAVEASRT
jgi:Bacterial PH domain